MTPKSFFSQHLGVPKPFFPVYNILFVQRICFLMLVSVFRIGDQRVCLVIKTQTCFWAREEIVCNPPQTNPNGGVSCTRGNRVGSQCSFECNPGYAFNGSATTECSRDGQWTNQPACKSRVKTALQRLTC